MSSPSTNNPDFQWIIGIDEVGRGPIAGPVTVTAFAVHDSFYPGFLAFCKDLKDSKKLTEKKREAWFVKFMAMRGDTLKIATTSVAASYIDRQGIGAALMHAVDSGLKELACDPEISRVLLDGSSRASPAFIYQETIIKGDEKEAIIAAASVIAKVTRDRHMVELSKKISDYGFEKHKGYGTAAHYAAIEKHGMCEEHRKTWIKELSK